MTDKDPRTIIAEGPLSRYQLFALITALALSAIEGFDLLAITFAAPGIQAEWKLGADAIGIMTSSGILGMAAGCVLISPLSDRVGRRPVILTSLALMTAGMAGCIFATDVYQMSALRALAGLGIGGVIGPVNAVVAELANARSKAMAISLLTCGISLGGMVGGAVAMVLLAYFDWRSIFLFGTVASLGALALAHYRLPESVDFLIIRRRGDALERINAILEKMNHRGIAALPTVSMDARTGQAPRAPRALIGVGLVIALMYMLQMVCNYFFATWMPVYAVGWGYTASDGASIMMCLSAGGIAGTLVTGVIVRHISYIWLAIVMLLGSGAAHMLLGQGGGSLGTLRTLAAVGGLCAFSAIACIYLMIVDIFPAQIRATAAGLIIAASRVGGIVSPTIAGFLLVGGTGRATVAILMASASVVSGALLTIAVLSRLIRPGASAASA